MRDYKYSLEIMKKELDNKYICPEVKYAFKSSIEALEKQIGGGSMSKKYLLLCNTHNSIHGHDWALFWGMRESENGYTSDLRVAHRFNEDDETLKAYKDSDRHIPIPIDVLGLSEEYEDEETINKNISVLIEKGTLNKLLGLNLRPLHVTKDYCSNCGEEID